MKTVCADAATNLPTLAPNKVPNKSEMAVLELLRNNPQLTRAELAQRLALSDSGVKRILAKLKASGLIERLSSNKSGRWFVNYPTSKKILEWQNLISTD